VANIVGEEPEVKRERTFTGEGLYGFMNGGADLFLEYDVQSLVNRDVYYKNEDFTIDIYEMPTPEDAFGIYSMHIFRCQQADTLDLIDCYSPYQMLAVAGNFYISIVFPSGSSHAQEIAIELIPLYTSVDKNIKPDFPEIFISGSPFSGNVKYLRGPLSVSSASSDLASVLQAVNYDYVWFTSNRKNKSYQAFVRFASQTEKEKFKKLIDASEITEEENSSLFIQRKEKKEEQQVSSPFGF
jgi:hypothetical protein